jgi:hypothetical protein
LNGRDQLGNLEAGLNMESYYKNLKEIECEAMNRIKDVHKRSHGEIL